MQIIHEQDEYIVLNKPAGIPVHPASVFANEQTVYSFLKENYPELEEVGETWQLKDGEIKRYGIAHRLDKETSGVLLVAKQENIFKYFKRLFKKRKIQKHYKAFLNGALKDEVVLINSPIGRDAKDFRRYTTKNPRGVVRDAETLIHLIEKKGKGNNGYSFVDIFPKTGRTHQIRVHCKHIGKPVVADALYGKKENDLGFNRVALHCYSLTFIDTDKIEKTYEAPLPIDFLKAKHIFDNL